MYYQNLMLNAIDVVLAREIPDEAFAEAVTAQANLMKGIYPD